MVYEGSDSSNAQEKVYREAVTECEEAAFGHLVASEVAVLAQAPCLTQKDPAVKFFLCLDLKGCHVMSLASIQGP